MTNGSMSFLFRLSFLFFFLAKLTKIAKFLKIDTSYDSNCETKREIDIVSTNSEHIICEHRARHYFENRNLAKQS